mgnify:CR=1 FL=1
MKKPVILFTMADKANIPYYKMFLTSLRKFHSEKDLPVVLYTEEQIKTKEDWYRAKPMFARELIKEYDLVIGADCDQLVLGNLDHIIKGDDYDVGTVLNINRVDPSVYGLISFGTIQPNEYYNNGLVALRSEKFINHWWNLCTSSHFNRMPMGEQGFLNVMCHYGDYKVRCFDRFDPIYDIAMWNGLVFKGESLRAKLEGKDVVLYPDKDNYPDRRTIIKLWHPAGGNTPNKMNYRLYFDESMIAYIDGLVKEDEK